MAADFIGLERRLAIAGHLQQHFRQPGVGPESAALRSSPARPTTARIAGPWARSASLTSS